MVLNFLSENRNKTFSWNENLICVLSVNYEYIQGRVSSIFILPKNGLIINGASVWPMKMFAAATIDSPAVVPTTFPITQPKKYWNSSSLIGTLSDRCSRNLLNFKLLKSLLDVELRSLRSRFCLVTNAWCNENTIKHAQCTYRITYQSFWWRTT